MCVGGGGGWSVKFAMVMSVLVWSICEGWCSDFLSVSSAVVAVH